MESGQEKFKQQKKPYVLPEEIRKEIEGIDEGSFWTEDNLERQFEDDIAFGVKMWTGLLAILERRKLSPDTREYREFNNRAEILNLKSYTFKDQARTLLELKDWMAKTWKVSAEEMNIKRILLDAYQEEAEATRMLGQDPSVHIPFSASLGLNKEHPSVKEALQKQAKEEVVAGGKLLEKLLESTPSLKKKMEEFERGQRQPPQERIE